MLNGTPMPVPLCLAVSAELEPIREEMRRDWSAIVGVNSRRLPEGDEAAADGSGAVCAAADGADAEAGAAAAAAAASWAVIEVNPLNSGSHRSRMIRAAFLLMIFSFPTKTGRMKPSLPIFSKPINQSTNQIRLLWKEWSSLIKEEEWIRNGRADGPTKKEAAIVRVS